MTANPESVLPPKCAQCKNPLGSYFEVSSVSASGKVAPKTVKTCSVLCLIQWAYNFGLMRGVQGLMQVKNLVSMIRGKKKPTP